MALSFRGQRISVTQTQSHGMIDLGNYSKSSINRSCTDLLPCWYAPYPLCVWENEPSLCLLSHKPPCWDCWWVYQMLPIQVLCQWPDIWIGHDNLQVMQLVPVSWRRSLNWVFLLGTGIFLIFSLQLLWKALMHFQRVAQNDRRHIKLLCQIPQLGGKGKKGHSWRYMIWCLTSIPY